MEGIKYINLVEIGSVFFELREVEIGNFSVRVNNTRVVRTTFLAARHTTVCLNNRDLPEKNGIQNFDMSKIHLRIGFA